MKNLIAVLPVLALSFFGLGCAGMGVTPHPASVSATRGSVVTHGQAVKAIVQGPTVIHAYAAETGGDLYAVPAVTGSDADCANAPSGDAPRGTTIRPDQRVVLTVEPGQIACVASSRKRSFELLWHAHGDTESHGHVDETQLALATRKRQGK